jgi:LPS-assembly protein
MFRRLLLLILWLLPLPLAAQDLATLVADRVSVSGQSILIAEGNVEVLYRGQRLRAASITYDRDADRLAIAGPIWLTDEKGNVIQAQQADLAADLTEGVLTSARMVMDQKLQIAADQIARREGRYTELTNTVASSCKVCNGRAPLWEIRASKITHDQQAQQLYFDNATLRMAGVPIFYLPRMRVPDPTLDRSSGFLVPRLRSTSAQGTGIKIPYFLTLGPSRDLTFTPYITTKGTRSIDLRYRQAFRTGSIEANGALSYDDLLPGERRGYFLGTGEFDLPAAFKLTFRLEQVSDPAYFLDYGISEKDRLDSRIEVTRTRRNEYIQARLVSFQSIREGESNQTIPYLLGDVTFHRRFSGGVLGGEAGLRFQTHSHSRRSTEILDLDGDGHADGRDLSRVSARLDWQRNWVLPAGILGTTMGELSADVYDIQQDAVYAGRTTRFDAAGAVELRWPWVAAGEGASYVVEPILQLVVNSRTQPDLPNEDSALVEWDEGNLFSMHRFAGSDARERGIRTNLGLSWTRYDAAGWSLGGTVGRVFRADDLGQFGASSGLDGRASDWLMAWQIATPEGLTFTNRYILSDDFEPTKAEARLDLSRDRYGLSGSYVLIKADPLEGRLIDTSELYLDGSYTFAGNWTAKASARHDFIADRATTAGVGLEFRNECLSVDLSLSRRFTSSTSVQPTTDFGLQVDLLGFGGGQAAGPARTCRR